MPHDVAIPAKAKVATPPGTAKQRLEQVAERFDRHANQQFKTLCRVEDMTLEVLRTQSASDTMFESIGGALLESGVKVDNTVGSIMAALDLTKDDVNRIACYCHNGIATAGSHIATSLRAIANDK